MLKVAIVGSGPSGFYAADALLKEGEVALDVIERLPTPYGLVRGGVAPDHQSTKRVERSFERTAGADAVRYFGNVEIGRDLTLDELRGLYDAVVLAVGAPQDRRLNVPGEEKAGVIGSAAFVGWYNGHPDFAHLDPPLEGSRAVVVGNGNVALDVARVLVKTPAEMAASDIAEHALEAIAAAPLKEVVLLGRRGPAEAKFTTKELSEFGTLEAAAPLVDPTDLPARLPDGLAAREQRLAERNIAVLAGFAARPPSQAPRKVRFLFHAKPREVLGGDRVEALRCERTRSEQGRLVDTGETFELPCGLVVAAIGYSTPAIEGVPFDREGGRLRNEGGRVAPGLYAVGWCKRGPTGVIGSNKADGDQVAEALRKELSPSAKPGRAGLERLLKGRGVTWVGFPEWQEIDRAERAAAAPGAPRRKYVSVADMLALLSDGGAGSEASKGAASERSKKPQDLRG